MFFTFRSVSIQRYSCRGGVEFKFNSDACYSTIGVSLYPSLLILQYEFHLITFDEPYSSQPFCERINCNTQTLIQLLSACSSHFSPISFRLGPLFQPVLSQLISRSGRERKPRSSKANPPRPSFQPCHNRTRSALSTSSSSTLQNADPEQRKRKPRPSTRLFYRRSFYRQFTTNIYLVPSGLITRLAEAGLGKNHCLGLKGCVGRGEWLIRSCKRGLGNSIWDLRWDVN